MIDRLFLSTMTFCMLIAGTLAIGSAMFGTTPRSTTTKITSAPVRIVQLERVVVVGKRVAPATTVAQNDVAAPAAQRPQ